MKKTVLAVMLTAVMAVSGCHKTSDLLSSQEPVETAPIATPEPVVTPEPVSEKATIHISETLKMTNDWTIIGDYNMALTGNLEKDRVILGTSAEVKNGQIMWDDTQYWTLAVINEYGAYNLFSERMTGQVYAEVGEVYAQGVATPVVTAYIFTGGDREIRNYAFVDDYFEETIVYSTKDFSTGGINCMYSTFPESDPK